MLKKVQDQKPLVSPHAAMGHVADLRFACTVLVGDDDEVAFHTTNPCDPATVWRVGYSL